MINYDDFQKIELRVAKIISAERIEGSEKLIRLQIDLGPSADSAGLPQPGSEREIRQIVAGIGKAYGPEELTGREIVVVVNLEPRQLMGIESRGMLLAAAADGPVLLVPDKEVPPGASIR